MTIKIQRLKLRIPQSMAGNAESYARSVAQGLARQVQPGTAQNANLLRVRVDQPSGAGDVAQAVGRAIKTGKDS